MLKALFTAALLAATTAAFAQSPAQPSPKADGKPRAHARYDCSQAKDPKACEERRSKFREAAQKARAACESATDKRACMAKEMCAQSAEPAKCEARAKARADQRKERREQRPAQPKSEKK